MPPIVNSQPLRSGQRCEDSAPEPAAIRKGVIVLWVKNKSIDAQVMLWTLCLN